MYLEDITRPLLPTSDTPIVRWTTYGRSKQCEKNFARHHTTVLPTISNIVFDNNKKLGFFDKLKFFWHDSQTFNKQFFFILVVRQQTNHIAFS